MYEIDLKNKVAVINGGSRGIGEAIARGLASCGAQVILCSRKQESVQEVADSIIADGGNAVARACHAGHLDEIESLFEGVRNDFGRLDILINNAATNPYYGPAAEAPPGAFDKTVNVNLKGPYYMMSYAVPLMAERSTSMEGVDMAQVTTDSFYLVRPTPQMSVLEQQLPMRNSM